MSEQTSSDKVEATQLDSAFRRLLGTTLLLSSLFHLCLCTTLLFDSLLGQALGFLPARLVYERKPDQTKSNSTWLGVPPPP